MDLRWGRWSWRGVGAWSGEEPGRNCNVLYVVWEFSKGDKVL